MKEWIIRLWTNETYFVVFVRGIIGLVGVAVRYVPDVPTWVGDLITAAALFIPAGEKNPKNDEGDPHGNRRP